MITRSAHRKSLTGGYQRTPLDAGRSEVGMDVKTARKMGRNGDTMLAHINPEEAALLKARGGSGTINPRTGLPEYGITSSGTGSSVSGISNDRSDFGGGQDNLSRSYGYGNAAGFYPNLNPEIGGPTAQPQREHIENTQPDWKEKTASWVIGAALPFGIDAEAVPDYIAGKPAISLSIAPMQTLANMAVGPFGDMLGSDWGRTEFARTTLGDPQHDPHTGRSTEEGISGAQEDVAHQQQGWRQLAQQMAKAVLQGPSQSAPPASGSTSAPPPSAPPRTYTPPSGDLSSYGQKGGTTGHRWFT